MNIPLIQVDGKYLFHPYLVHFPIALFVLEAFLIGLWIVKRDEKHEHFAFFVLKAAIFTMPLVMLAGFVDAGGLIPRVKTHFFMAVGLFVLNGARLIIRWKAGAQLWQSEWRIIYPVLVLAGTLLTILTGHFGGKLVYF